MPPARDWSQEHFGDRLAVVVAPVQHQHLCDAPARILAQLILQDGAHLLAGVLETDVLT